MTGLFKEILGAQIWQAAILLCTMMVQLAAARFIGPAGLGTTAVIVSVSSLCVLLIELNLQSALVRAVSVALPLERGQLQGNALEGRLALGLVLAPVAALVASVVAENNKGLIFIGIIGAVIAQELNPGWWLQGIGKSSRSFLLNGCVSLTTCVIAIPLIYYIRKPAMENLLASAVGLTWYGTYWTGTHQFSQPASRLYLRIEEYIQFAWRHRSFLLGGAAVYLYLYPAQLLLASTRTVEEAGLYRVALMPGTAYYAITVAAFNAYYPRIIRAHAAGETEYRSILRWLIVLIFGVGAIAWLAVDLGKGLFGMAIGHGFGLSVDLAPVLIISKAIGGVGLVLRAALLAHSKERLVFRIFFFVGLATLATNMLIIPRYGLLGAAMVELTQETLHLLILLVVLFSISIHAYGSARVGVDGQPESLPRITQDGNSMKQ